MTLNGARSIQVTCYAIKIKDMKTLMYMNVYED